MRVPRFPIVDGLVMRMHAYRWVQFMNRHGEGALVSYIFHPMFLPYVKRVAAKYLVYHAYDLYEHTPGWSEGLARDQRILLDSADMVVAASEQIARALHAQVKRDIRVLPNGADIEALNQALSSGCPEPPDLAEISHPRLGWVGSLHPQVDLGLVAELAMRRPDWNFVFVGNLVAHSDPRSDAERAKCRNLANVHFLGAKSIEQVPQYLVNMDVNLMLYRMSGQSWVTSGYPLKLHEYLAAGRPVVSVDLPTVRPFSDVVRIADGVDDWLAAIQEALTEGGRGTSAQRRAVAAVNGWEQRAATLDAWLMDLIKTA
jgi:glycosyltransferase involved in cell wall biosynthesis